MSALAFTAPWLLWGLVALPILWLLLRAIPPAPIRRRFPAVALLLGLNDEDRQADKTPWWLLLLRALAIAAAIIGFAGPVMNPENRASGRGPLLIVLDAGWADARDWQARMDKAKTLLTEAGTSGRAVAVIALTAAPQPVNFQDAEAWSGRLAAIEPQAFAPTAYEAWAKSLPVDGFDSYLPKSWPIRVI
jgi:Aerotolerance regulator N-terminal